VDDVVIECKRDEIATLENTLSHKDNHVVLIFQVLYDTKDWKAGMYYAFLFDHYCIIGKQIVLGYF